VDLRVWVDPDRWTRAENVLLRELADGHPPTARSSRNRGTIFDDRITERLRRSWGFCTGHAWLYLAVEAELAGCPRVNAAIYEDLTSQAVGVFTDLPSGRCRRRALDAIGQCLLCEYGSAPEPFGKVVSVTLRRGWAAASSPRWVTQRCSVCVPGIADGVVCRRHASRRDLRSGALVQYVTALRDRCGRRTLDGDAALIEAVGWFSGWPAAAAAVDGGR
jgi:hypothetical protein